MKQYIQKGSLRSRCRIIFIVMLPLFLFTDFPGADIVPNVFVKEAQAVVGRPATPGSVGGVRRRTRRRTAVVVGSKSAAAHETRVNTLPASCSKVVIDGVTYHNCGGTYYRPYYEADKVVYVVSEDPKKTKDGTQPPPVQAESSETVEQKLQELKNMYDKDLITQEEYETQKKRVLDSM